MSQMIPAKRTIGEVIELLQQYPPEVLVSGISKNTHFSCLCTIQGNCPDEILNNVGIYFWDEEELKPITRGDNS